MSIRNFISSKWNTDYVVTRYQSKRDIQEYFVDKRKLLGPVSNLDENDHDFIFELDGIPGIFVTSKKETIIIKDEDGKKLLL